MAEINKAIHQCVIHSTIRHVLSFPLDAILHYFATNPFYRGADTLYYLILKKVGKSAYYAPNGQHIISIQPELTGVYVLAEQDMNAPISIHDSKDTIYPILKRSIDRNISCQRYAIRHSIITGDASIETAITIPSISLNIPKYQNIYQNAINNDISNIGTVIDQDCWEPIKQLNFAIMSMMIMRMTHIKTVAPDLWSLVLQKYYTDQLIRLNIHNFISNLISKQIIICNILLPDLIRLPPNLDTLGVRLWFTPRAARAYLLGFDLTDGVPSDESVSEQIQHLQQIGIEEYAKEITGIHMSQDTRLTGRIGNTYYDYLVGKTLILPKNISKLRLLSTSYVYDLLHVVVEDKVYIISLIEILNNIDPNTVITPEYIIEYFASGKFPDIKEILSIDTARRISTQLNSKVGTKRCIPARTRLVEILSHDVVDYNN